MVVWGVGVYCLNIKEERLLEHGSASAQTSRCLDGRECCANECISDDGVWAARAHEQGNGNDCQKRVGFRRCTRVVYTRRVVRSPTPPVRVVVEHESSVGVGVGVDGSDTVSIGS